MKKKDRLLLDFESQKLLSIESNEIRGGSDTSANCIENNADGSTSWSKETDNSAGGNVVKTEGQDNLSPS